MKMTNTSVRAINLKAIHPTRLSQEDAGGGRAR